ncbi:MAG: hypothetical protein K2H50_04185 [Paramuribaculum sp.]|nr:hypothetical protein [Paramuribaculum sp.]
MLRLNCFLEIADCSLRRKAVETAVQLSLPHFKRLVSEFEKCGILTLEKFTF